MHTFNRNVFFYHSQLFGDKEVPGEELHEILREIDTNMNGQVELDEYLQVCESSHARICHIVLLLLSNFFLLHYFFCCIYLNILLTLFKIGSASDRKNNREIRDVLNNDRLPVTIFYVRLFFHNLT